MIYIDTRKGKYHDISEDAFLVGDVVLSDDCRILPVPEKGFVCVADGVGGNHGGAEAAEFVLSKLSKQEEVESPEKLKEVLCEINSHLVYYGIETPPFETMATTLTGIYLSDVSNILVHVGNTRAYVMQGNYLKQITQDHTVYNWLKAMGRYDDAEACNKNEITSCFGGGNSSLIAKLYVSEIPYFNKILLTSDGVHEYVNIDSLEDILNNTLLSNQEKCARIIDAALAAGSEDDITVALLHRKEE